jgi:hypothetical protein
VLNCLAALRFVEIENSKLENIDINEYELVKRKVFSEAISMMINAKCDSDQYPILSAFLGNEKMSKKGIWLPMHWAITLTVGNKISEEDVHILHAVDPLVMRLLSKTNEKGGTKRYSPIHLLCMHKRLNISLVRYFSLRDPQAFIICNQGGGGCALHMVAQHSESLEALQSVLQIDHTVTSKPANGQFRFRTTALGLLCGRLEFPSFQEMFLRLIEVDSTVEVIFNGMIQCMRQYEESTDEKISPGSRGDRTVILLRKLLDSNGDVSTYKHSSIFHMACKCLRGELCIAVLSLFFTKNRDGIKSVDINYGCLPIHLAVAHSSLDVVKFLVKAYPESLSMVVADDRLDEEGCALLHLALKNKSSYADAIVEYLCDICPALLLMKKWSRSYSTTQCSYT